jgi:hypothetical protein
MITLLHALFPDVTVWDWRSYTVAALFCGTIGIGVLLAINGLAGRR